MKQLLERLREQEVFISLDNDKLRIKFNGEKLPDPVLNEIKNSKEEIISYLRQSENKNSDQFQISKTDLPGGYPLSSSQRRIWVLCHFNEGRLAYNTPEFYEFNGQLDVKALERAINLLVERHEILRTVFQEDENGEIKQFILPAEKGSIKIIASDLRNTASANEKLNEILKKENFF
ncbi:MAG: hypothetical protein IAF38_07695, partial [Bacteroidia bacterium]|nr:hypothetical protein [Bacteroidia bacterium]